MPDKYKDLRAALNAGPTPGPWDYGADPCLNNEAALAICKQNIDAHTKPSSGYFFVVYVGDGRRTALVGHGPDGEANARLIAAANPETIRALLADYDLMQDALEKVRPVIAAGRQALLDTHGNGIEIPAADELGTLGLYEYDGALHAIDAALTQGRGR